MWERPNLFSLVKSIFIGQIYFDWSNLFCGIYGVRPSVTKTDFFSEKSLSEKRLCLSTWEWPSLVSLIKSIFIVQKRLLFVNVGVAESIFTSEIYFHWPNLFSLVESILWHIWCTSQCNKN